MGNLDFKQFLRFGIVGTIGVFVDFGILNLLSFLTGIYAGLGIIVINSISFLAAVVNNYLLNKYWTFKSDATDHAREFSRALLVYVGGLIINTGIVYYFTTIVGPSFGFSPLIWVNLAKAIGVGVAMVWNFVGMKFFVFAAKV